MELYLTIFMLKHLGVKPGCLRPALKDILINWTWFQKWKDRLMSEKQACSNITGSR